MAPVYPIGLFQALANRSRSAAADDDSMTAYERAIDWGMRALKFAVDAARPSRSVDETLRSQPLALPRDSADIERRFGRDVCIASDGMVTCRIPGTGLVTPPFAQRKDWPDRLGPSDPDFHYYNKSVEAPRMAGLLQALTDDPAPGAEDQPATPQGTRNNATPPGQGPASWFWSPVQSFVMTDPRSGARYVFNATLPGHPLHPGFVARVIRPAGQGRAIVDNIGAGAGIAQSSANPLADYFSSFWSPTTQEAIDRAGAGETSRNVR
jgi:hypothetical protein